MNTSNMRLRLEALKFIFNNNIITFESNYELMMYEQNEHDFYDDTSKFSYTLMQWLEERKLLRLIFADEEQTKWDITIEGVIVLQFYYEDIASIDKRFTDRRLSSTYDRYGPHDIAVFEKIYEYPEEERSVLTFKPLSSVANNEGGEMQ